MLGGIDFDTQTSLLHVCTLLASVQSDVVQVEYLDFLAFLFTTCPNILSTLLRTTDLLAFLAESLRHGSFALQKLSLQLFSIVMRNDVDAVARTMLSHDSIDKVTCISSL